MIVNTLTAPACKFPDMRQKTLAERARFARARAGFERESDAAAAIGCSRPLVISWEDGTAKSIGGKYLIAAARAYRVRPDWLQMEVPDDGYPWESSEPPAPSQSVRDERRMIEAVAVVMDHLRDFTIDPLPADKRREAINAAYDLVESVGLDGVLNGSKVDAVARQVVATIRKKRSRG